MTFLHGYKILPLHSYRKQVTYYINRVAFSTISVAPWARPRIIGVLPTLSAPFLTPKAKVSHPRPISASKKMIINIPAHLTIMYFYIRIIHHDIGNNYRVAIGLPGQFHVYSLYQFLNLNWLRDEAFDL